MSTSLRKKTCFVIMPFGDKTDFDGKAIDFDDIYRFFIKKTVEGFDPVLERLEIDCIRCDEIEESGSLHEKMIQQIYNADIVVVDISTCNANVYYELGIRHALAKGVTVLVRRRGTTIPFNIQGLQVVEYDQGKFGSVEQAKAKIRQIIANGLQHRRNDSPVHAVLDLNIEREGKPIDETTVYEWSVKARPDRAIGLITGDIQHVTGIDVWVNSENTNMQMARPFENSISGIIRYLGAEKDPDNGQITKDTIVEELRTRMEGQASVAPATIVVTTAGSMKETHKVKRIFHAAANYGQVGQGYVPIDSVARCVSNALRTWPDDCRCEPMRTILFPLMATRSTRGAVLEERVKPLINAAVDYLVRTYDDRFRKVYFLAYTDKELEVCRDILHADAARLHPMTEVRTSKEGLAAETPVSGRPAAIKSYAFMKGELEPSRAEPSPAKPSQAEPSQAEPSQAETA